MPESRAFDKYFSRNSSVPSFESTRTVGPSRTLPSRLLSFFAHPICPKGTQPGKHFTIPSAIARCFAGDDVVNMTDRKAFNVDASFPSISDTFDSIRREH